jgi:hypothetical protein
MEATAWTLHDRHKAFCGDRKPKATAHTLKSPSVDRDEREFQGIIAADILDLEREVIIPEGLRYGKGRYFMGTTKAVYLDHSWADKNVSARDRLPVAVCRNIADRGDTLFATTRMAELTIGDELMELIDCGAINGLSVGVLGDDEGPPTPLELKKYGPRCQNVIRTGDMLEYSIVSMPANPAAVLKCLDRGMIRRPTASLFMPSEVSPVRKSFPVDGPAKCTRTIMLTANMDILAVV